MRVLRDLRRLLSVAGFRRLLTVRLLSQGADGVFQVILTAYLFFSPERQTTPGAIAVVTAATLLPFTLVGPFAGVLLDRWARRDVLVGAPVVRALLSAGVAGLLLSAAGADIGGGSATDGGVTEGLLFCLVVAGFAVNRFLLSALSAALPHTIPDRDLLSANAVVPTAGTIAYTVGLGLGGVWQGLLGGPDDAVAETLGLAAGLWLLAATAGSRFARPELGPDLPAVPRGAAGRTAADAGRAELAALAGGVRHLRSRPQAGAAVLLVGAQRVVAGLVLVAAILLHRGTYAAPDDPSTGLAGLGLTVAAAGVGLVLAALVFPTLATRTSLAAAVCALLLGAAVVQAVFATVGSEGWLVATAFALSLSGHALKIAADTLVQHQVSDDHRGRVFSLYDVVFNAGLISAAVLGALALPIDGDSASTMGVAAVALAGIAAVAARVLPSRAVGAPARS